MKKKSEIKDILVSCFLIMFCLWGISNVVLWSPLRDKNTARETVPVSLASSIHGLAVSENSGNWQRDPEWKDQEKPVMLFVTGWCGACRALERSMGKSGLIFRKADIEVDTEANRNYSLIMGSSSGPVPLALVGTQVVLGNQFELIVKLAREG